MDGQTICQYGTVVLYRCVINKFDQRPVMDSTNTDMKHWQFNVTVTGFLSGEAHRHVPTYDVVDNSMAVDTILDDSAAIAHRQVRWRLLPRQMFKLVTGCASPALIPLDIDTGVTLLYAEPFSGQISTPPTMTTTRGDGNRGMTFLDCHDGPRCVEFTILQACADNTFKVQASFEIHRMQCDDDDSASNETGVLSHRFSSAESLDHNMRSTRIYRGLLEIVSAQFSPHWFRWLVVPPLSQGFRRERMNFTATEDGKKLAYEVVDQEIAIAAPPPARRWSIRHTEVVVSAEGTPSGHGSIDVELEGDSNCDKMQLIMLGLYIISAKLLNTLFGEPLNAGDQTTLGQITITDFTGDVNMVHLSATCQSPMKNVKNDNGDNAYSPRQQGFQKILQFPRDLPKFCVGYFPRLSYGAKAGDPVEYQGPAPLVNLFRSYLQNPCSDQFGINNRTNRLTTDYNVPGIAVAVVEPAQFSAVVSSSITETNGDFYSSSNNSNQYTHYQCETQYDTKSMRAAMPIATSPHTGSGPDTRDGTAIVQLTKPQTTMQLRIAAERVGEWPEFPDGESVGAESSGQNQYATTIAPGTSLGSSVLMYPLIAMKLIKSALLGKTVEKDMLGNDKYHARWEGLFALTRAPTPTETLKFGHNKWSTDNEGKGNVSNEKLTNSSFK